MYFTREPITEAVISARDGFQLVIRNCQKNEEDHFVEAVRVVSIGGDSLFFLATEAPYFFLPTSHYEVLELKKTRNVVKYAEMKKNKAESILPRQRQLVEEKKEEPKREDFSEEESQSLIKRKGRISQRRRMAVVKKEKELSPVFKEKEKTPSISPPKELSSSSLLVPPPAMLISEKLQESQEKLGDKKSSFFSRFLSLGSSEKKEDDLSVKDSLKEEDLEK